MPRKRPPASATPRGEKAAITLPRNALTRINLGSSFAEYDLTLKKRDMFVRTPATMAAEDSSRQKYFFVGRRGTGKTATGLELMKHDHHSRQVLPGIFSPSAAPIKPDLFLDPRQKPYRSLISAFKRVMLDEVLALWTTCCGAAITSMPAQLQDHAHRATTESFDTRLLSYIDDLIAPLSTNNDRRWLEQIHLPKELAETMSQCRWSTSHQHTLVIDRIDDLWDGADVAVSYLSALMHAALQLSAQENWMRVLVFVRENVFERVRAIDPEFSRLETSVVGMDWTSEQLMEMVERRLNEPFSTRLSIGGETWDYFFENPTQSRDDIFSYCQNRPRDVLIYCEFALQNAVSHSHEKILIDDVLVARRRFSDSRLNDLGDEYSENYPQISNVLSRFYGLGRRFTLRGIEDFCGSLLSDFDIQRSCGEWLNENATPELFTRILYNIGFAGLLIRDQVSYRSSGPRDTTPPAITSATDIVIHPSYWDSLDLQDLVITELDEARPHHRVGLVADIPEAMSPAQYVERLSDMDAHLSSIPKGHDGAAEFEDLVGEMLDLCFHRSLRNPEAHSRDIDGRTVRDWTVSNRADSGFWEVVRQRYNAVQITWECKNYEDLSAEDFQQMAYYLTPASGRFGLIVFRGQYKSSYDQHVRRIASDKDGMVLLLNERDIRVFLRQARNGKVKDAHIQDIYDRMVRLLS